jgi:exonuclease SbcD
VLTDRVLPPEAMARLRTRFPHALTLVHRPPEGSAPADRGYAARVRGRSDIDLTLDFVEHVTGTPATDDERVELVAVVSAADTEDRP